MIHIGIDPGASGGVCWIGSDGVVTVTALKTLTLKGLWEWFDQFNLCPEVHATIEKVGGYMGSEAGESVNNPENKNKAPGHTMFNFGKGVGHLEAFLTAASIPFQEVAPQRWVKEIGITPRKKTESKTEWKRRCRSVAERLFPTVKMTNAISDSLLLAEYSRRTRGTK